MKRKYQISLVILLLVITLFVPMYFMNYNRTSIKEDNIGEKYIEIEKKYDFLSGSKSLFEWQLVQSDIEIKKTVVTGKIVAVGDIMFHSPQIKSGYNDSEKIYDFYPVFQRIEKYIKDADIALGNYETVAAGKEYKFGGYPRFNAPKETLKALSMVGFDILSTVNNHSIDRGKDGIVNTIDHINEYNMVNIGTYKSKDREILIRNVNGINIAFLSYSYGFNGLDVLLSNEELSYMVNTIDEEKIKNDIVESEELGADIVTVVIHWGNEYQLTPSKEQVDLAYKMIDWGADVILGSHPHVIQKSEIVKRHDGDKFIIYSMGNFVSNQRIETISNKNRSHTEDGVIVSLEFEKNKETGKTRLKDFDYIPTWVNRYYNNGKSNYEILPTLEYIDDDNSISQDVFNRIKNSYDRTMRKMFIVK